MAFIHGETGTRLHRMWSHMKDRCRNPKSPNWGGRGISYDPSWENYETFRDWALANGFREDLTIERKDVNGGYTPKNCTFIAYGHQVQNRRKWKTYKKKKPSSCYKGVNWWSPHGTKWAAQIRFNKLGISLGLYSSEHEAAYAYNVASKILFFRWAAKNDIPLRAISPRRRASIKADVTRRISSKPGAMPCESTTR